MNPNDPTPPPSTPNQEIGYAVSVNDYLVSANGLPNVSLNELVVTSSKARGLVTNLKSDLIDILMLDETKVKPREMFTRTHQAFSVSVGEFLLGRTVNALGLPIDSKGRFPQTEGKVVGVDSSPRGIKTRELITEQFNTQVTLVDMLMPLAKGQRELIIGDASSGKTSFIIDTIVNQKSTGVICIYAMIGKSISEIRQLVDILNSHKAMDYSIIIASSSSDLASLIYLTPFVAFSTAEYFQGKGKDVLLILDDMGSHAKFYREISLLSNKSPGRESYPGDIFYQQAHLMEKAGRFNSKSGGGSITAIPVVEINQEDYTAFIPSNLMAMTDGHLKFDSNLYRQGHRPAIDLTLSVSRVGRQTQWLPQKLLSDRVRSVIAESQKLETLTRFGSDISSQTQLTLKQSSQIDEILRQSPLSHIPIIAQMIMLGLVFTTFFSSKDVDFVAKNKDKIVQYLTTQVDLNPFTAQVSRMRDDRSFLKAIEPLIPTLESICRA